MLSVIAKYQRKLQKKLHVLNEVRLSTKALIYNLRFYKNLHPESVICPVLKSNAYGHGLVSVGQILNTTKGKLRPPYLVVDSYYEYQQLSTFGVKIPCLIIGYSNPENLKLMKFKNVTLSILNKEYVDELIKLNKKVKVHIKVDSGMNRQGIHLDELDEVYAKLKKARKIKVEGVFSHLADADNPKNNEHYKKQVKDFKKAIKMGEEMGFKFKYKHISATAGAGKIFDKEFNMIRLGLGLYGLTPIEQKDPNFKKYKLDQLKPILELVSQLDDIKDLKKGEKVSYNCTYTAEKAMRIGVLPVGYYEGVDRRLSNKGYVYYKNTPCRILGRVCMNLIVVDISKIKNPKIGDNITVIGDNNEDKNSIKWISKTCDEIPYVIWTHIASSIRRVVV